MNGRESCSSPMIFAPLDFFKGVFQPLLLKPRDGHAQLNGNKRKQNNIAQHTHAQKKNKKKNRLTFSLFMLNFCSVLVFRFIIKSLWCGLLNRDNRMTVNTEQKQRMEKHEKLSSGKKLP